MIKQGELVWGQVIHMFVSTLNIKDDSQVRIGNVITSKNV